MLKPPTIAQIRARRENYGIFTLKGMLSNLYHLRHIASVDKSDLSHVKDVLRKLQGQIEDAQRERRMHKGLNGK